MPMLHSRCRIKKNKRQNYESSGGAAARILVVAPDAIEDHIQFSIVGDDLLQIAVDLGLVQCVHLACLCASAVAHIVSADTGGVYTGIYQSIKPIKFLMLPRQQCRQANYCLYISGNPGISSQVRPSSSLPLFFLLVPPHCLKKKATPAFSHCS